MDLESGNLSKRKKILNEIYDTEKTYQHHLMLLTTLFVDPIKISSVLPVNVIDGIFSNIEAIQSVSVKLLKLMKEDGVVHALLQLAPYLKLYSLYANNFDNSNKLLEECTKKFPEFGRLVRLQENQEEMESLKLAALLLTPIQRVPRYCLLLGNLLEQTTRDCTDDFIKLKDALEKLKNVANHINECVRQHENFHKMLSIQNRFIGGNIPQIIVPGRLFIKEGNLIKVNSRGQAKERFVFLFSDILVLAKKEGNGIFSWCDTYFLKDCIVEDVLGNNKEHGNGLFRIICDDKSTLLCSKDEETSWILKIRNCVRQLQINLASLRRRSSESSNASGGTVQIDRPRTKISSLPTFKSLTSSTASPVYPNKLLKRQKTRGNEKWNANIYTDDVSGSMEEGRTRFYHHNDSYGCSVSLNTSKSDDEVFRDSTHAKPTKHRRQNWSLSEPTTIEQRPPLRSIRVSAKQVTVKLGCKRKQESDSPTERCGGKKRHPADETENEIYKIEKRIGLASAMTSSSTTEGKGNQCLLM